MSGKRKAKTTAAKKRKAASGKAEESTRRRRVKKALKWTGISGLVLILLSVLTFAILYKTIDIPDPNADFQTEASFIYYSDGKTELGKYATQNRDSIPLDEVPETVRDAVVAAENRSFWSDNGLDPKGILRAAFSNAQGNNRQGASTITQQYVKILYLSQDQTYTRKVKEAIVSLKLHRQQSKEEILSGYLNTIYFGRGAYGIQAAAKAYFDKPASKLNLRQSVVLASVINNPSKFDPAGGKEARADLKDRYTHVLNGMADMDQISAERAEKAARRLPKFPKIEGESSYGGQKGHALEMIKRELLRLGFKEDEINGGGLRVTTTLTKKAMQASEQGVEEARPEGKDLHIASASVEPGTGALRGFYGGQDYLDSQINWAVAGGAPGSTFKMFAIAAGLKAGFALKDTFDGNSPYEFPDGTRIRNLGSGSDGLGTDYGTVSLTKATEDSINTAFIDLTMSLPNEGEDVLKMAHAMGIPKWKRKQSGMDHLRTSPGLEANPQIALGSATVSPINMANGYATVANGGETAPVYLIDKVVDRYGETKYRHKVNNKRVLDEDLAADTSYALEQVVTSGSGTGAQALGRPAAGKTGTATNDDDEVSSSWFVGFTPQMSTAVMIVRGSGNESVEEELPEYYGGSYPTDMWSAIMSRALDGEDVLDLAEPVYVDGDAPEEGHAPYTPPPPPETNDGGGDNDGGGGNDKPKPSKTIEQPSPTKSPSDPPTEPTDKPSSDDPGDPDEPPSNGDGNNGGDGNSNGGGAKPTPPSRDPVRE